MITITKYDKVFFENSKKWLSDLEIKKLTLTPDIDDASREKWFCSLKNKDDYLIWGLKYDDAPIGALGIKNIDWNRGIGEYWGYIGEKTYIGKGYGKEMICFVTSKALKLKLKKLYLKVADYNVRALNCYKKSGFVEVDRIDDRGYKLIIMEKKLC